MYIDSYFGESSTIFASGFLGGSDVVLCKTLGEAGELFEGFAQLWVGDALADADQHPMRLGCLCFHQGERGAESLFWIGGRIL